MTFSLPAFPAFLLHASFLLLLTLASTNARATPERVQAQIAGNGSTACAIDSDGTLRCWGQAGLGQTGYGGTATDVLIPTMPIGAGPGQHVQVSAGPGATCAVNASGGVACWGFGFNGEMGNGTTNVINPSPIPVTGLSSGVVQVSVGSQFVCAVMQTGAVKCWGAGNNGQMGNGTTIAKQTTPADVTSLPEGAIAVAAGEAHACALTPARGVKCWGVNTNGQLGLGTSTGPQSTAQQVVGLTGGVRSLHAGHGSTCAILYTNEMRCWGVNNNGQFGMGNIAPPYTPLSITPLGDNVATVSLSGTHLCAVLTSGAVKCAGNNFMGYLGDGTSNNASKVFVDVVGLSEGIVAVAALINNTCALTGLGRVTCWGGGTANGTGATNITPAAVPSLGFHPQFTFGTDHTCVLNGAGAVLCTGINEDGQLGIPGSGPVNVYTQVPGLESGVRSIGAGLRHTCAAMEDGTVRCWGYNLFGQIGDGTTVNRPAPFTVPDLFEVASIAASGYNTCALKYSGDVFCWGWNNVSQLADGTQTNRSSPVQANVGAPVRALFAGGQSNCAITTAGAFRCWGGNFYGELGTGTPTSIDGPPTDVPGFESGTLAGTIGFQSACAVNAAGALFCWGRNDTFQVGDGTSTHRGSPVQVPGLTSGVTNVVATGAYTCAVVTGGALKCWGANTNGALGDGTFEFRSTPVDITGIAAVDVLARGLGAACITERAGATKCWGYNGAGGLGDGTNTNRIVPTAMQGFVQRLTAALPTQGSVGQVLTLSATATSGLPVTFTTYSPATCSVSGNALTLLASGTCRVHATQAGDSRWSPAPSVVTTFGVIPAVAAPQSITFGALADRAYSPTPFNVAATAGSGLPVTFSSLTPLTCTSSGTLGATITMTGVGVCEVAVDQAGSSLWMPAPRVTQTFTISKATQTITFLGIVEDRRITDGLAQLIVHPDMDQAGSGEPLTFVSLTPETCVTSTGEPRGRDLLLVGIGPCTNTVNKAGNALYLAAPETQVTFQVVKAPGVSRADVTGDGRSDVIWYHTGVHGLIGMPANGLALDPYYIIDVRPSIDWRLAGLGDLDGDGRADVVWQNMVTGEVDGLLMNGGTVLAQARIALEPNLQWRILQIADTDGDGKADLVWKNSVTGDIYVMKMNGLVQNGGQVVYTEPDLNWKLIASGDMNGDGKADLLWRNFVTGDVFAMIMNGFTVVSGGVIYTEPNLDWKIVGLADFNGDGKADVLWQNITTGDVFQMQMNGTTVLAGNVIYTEPAVDWVIVALGDYNGDGKADILWQNTTTGNVYMMLMNGFTVTAANFVYAEPDLQWMIVGP